MSIGEIVRAFEQLGSLPAVRKRLFELAADPSASSMDIAEVIALDPSLTVRLIAESNKQRYETVFDIPAAAQILETDDIRKAAHSSVENRRLDEIAPPIMDYTDFWSNSVCCALAASSIARRSSIGDGGLMYTTGLLHNIGGPVIYMLRAREIARILDTESAADGAGTERIRLQIRQAELTSQLLQYLGIPNKICQIIRDYPEPYRARDYVKETCALHVAQAIAQEMRPSWKSGSVREAKSTIHPYCSRSINNPALLIDQVKREVESAFDYASELIQPSIF